MCGKPNDQWEKCTILWYVEYNKLSCMDPKVNYEIIEDIKKWGLMVYQERRHTFLGINITITEEKLKSILSNSYRK